MGRPSDSHSTPPDHAAASSSTASRGSCRIATAPSRRTAWAWPSKRATTMTSTSGCRARRMAVAVVPSAPAPYTSALPPGGGGRRVTEGSDTANGSASTASSSGTVSGTRQSCESWAGISSAQPPRAGDDPVRREQPRVVHVHEPHRRGGQPPEERVVLLGRWLGFGSNAVEQGPHRPEDRQRPANQSLASPARVDLECARGLTLVVHDERGGAVSDESPVLD